MSIWGHGPLEALSADGCLVFGNNLIHQDGITNSINLPEFLHIPPFPNIYAITCDLLAVGASTRNDTVFSKASQHTQKSPGRRRPPGGILRVEHTEVFILMHPDGRIVKQEDLGIHGGIHAVHVFGDCFITELVKRTGSYDDPARQHVALWDFNGNLIWEKEQPRELVGQIYWHGDYQYLYAITSNTTRLLVIDKYNGQIVGSIEVAYEDRFGSGIDIFREKNRIYLSRWGEATEGKPQLRTFLFAFDTSKIKRVDELDGLLLKPMKPNTIVYYGSKTEAYRENLRGILSQDFNIKVIQKEN